jgi:hypothetical protein
VWGGWLGEGGVWGEGMCMEEEWEETSGIVSVYVCVGGVGSGGGRVCVGG